MLQQKQYKATVSKESRDKPNLGGYDWQTEIFVNTDYSSV